MRTLSDTQATKDGAKLIEQDKCVGKCFAKVPDGCRAYTVECPGRCKWYKPKECKDWIRVERDGEAWLIPPEEYYVTTAEENLQNMK